MPRKLPHGYQATCKIPGVKKELTKSFSYREYGDQTKEKAEQHERKWRLKYDTSGGRFKTKLLKSNTSGIPGVNFSSGYDKRRDKTNYYAQASWVNKKGKPCSRSFSIKKHGKEGAWNLAVRARIIAMYGKRAYNRLSYDNRLAICEGKEYAEKL